MDMVSLLDDSPGEEIALLIMMLAAATVAPAPQQKAEPTCPTERILVAYEYDVPIIAPFGWSQASKDQALLVSKILEPDKYVPKQKILPRGEPGPKGPSVLTPACKTDHSDKKDYPMA